ncbi:hypothetical protein IB60_16630 [Brucella abortus LMN1]|nr:hypothetical protein IB60_16630 [Brucella abortus LMN1]KFH24289.1 hypothetical protein IB61_11565 [Brucella abortus LMN2]
MLRGCDAGNSVAISVHGKGEALHLHSILPALTAAVGVLSSRRENYAVGIAATAYNGKLLV